VKKKIKTFAFGKIKEQSNNLFKEKKQVKILTK
jgi:hypothetical protein